MTDPAAPAAPTRRGWLRRNLAALIVLVVAIPGLVLVVYVFPTIERQQQSNVIPVAQGEPVEVDGYSFTLTKSQEFVGTGDGPDGNGIPIGSSLVGTILEITPLANADPDSSCEIDLSERTGGKELSWSHVSNPADFRYGIGEDRSQVCLLDGDPREVETVFLTPTGAYTHATVDVSGIGNALGTDIYRFTLVH